MDEENLYLKRKGLPATERAFVNEYGVSMKKASNALKELVIRIHEIHPETKINHNQWRPQDLIKFFRFAGHDYNQLIKNIKQYNQPKFIPQKCIDEICREY